MYWTNLDVGQSRVRMDLDRSEIILIEHLAANHKMIHSEMNLKPQKSWKSTKIWKKNWKNLNLIQLSCGTRSGPHCKMYSKLICFRPCSSVRLTGQKHVENVEGESNIFNMLQRQHGNIICHICLQSYTLLPSFYLCQNTHWQFYKYQTKKFPFHHTFDEVLAT